MLVIKIISDLISFIGTGTACYAVNKENFTYSIICYYETLLRASADTSNLVRVTKNIHNYFKKLLLHNDLKNKLN